MYFTRQNLVTNLARNLPFSVADTKRNLLNARCTHDTLAVLFRRTRTSIHDP
jgi:hypothetical protein